MDCWNPNLGVFQSTWHTLIDHSVCPSEPEGNYDQLEFEIFDDIISDGSNEKNVIRVTPKLVAFRTAEVNV